MLEATPSELPDFLAGGSEMAELIRAKDWSQTPLGAVDSWPQSLRTTVSVCLNSRFPILLWWGPDLLMLYNDAYRPMLGATKHPRALGAAGREIWPEIWDIIGPMLNGVVAQGEATWSDDLLLVLERNGYPEECYFTFSYSPIRDESGGVGGVFTAVHETTQRVIGERRLHTLRELAAEAARAATEAEARVISLDVLARNPTDFPFALLYRLDGDGAAAHLDGVVGLPTDSPAAVPEIGLAALEAGADLWPLRDVLVSGQPLLVEGLSERFGILHAGPWPESPPTQAYVLPLGGSGVGRPVGLLVAGLNARRAFDDDYKGFCDLITGHIGTAMSNARAYEEERARAAALAELDRAKTAFFSNVSHEFRTPLTLILGPLEDAVADETEPRQRERLELMQRNALRLQKLVNTLLDFSRIEADRVQAAYQPTDLAALTTDLASVFRSTIEEAGLRYLVDCPPLPEVVYVDRDMWEKIVLNLLSNAFKFTIHGEIAVTLRPAPSGVELVVRDTGVGIPAAEMPRIFDRFHRVESTQARTYEGTGIGLALVQELVRLHGGTLQVQSEEGKGSAFTVAIPFGTAHLPSDRIGAQPSGAAASLTAEHYLEEALRWLPDASPAHPEFEPLAGVLPRPTGDATPPRIVWADDNADMRAYVSSLLAPYYEVEAVPDGEAALAAVQRQRPDLVLADVMMPRLDGFGLLRALRDDERTRTLPVILLSARAGEEARVEGLRAGADAYLVKPFSARELLARIQSRLDLARATAALARQQEMLQTIMDRIPVMITMYDPEARLLWLNAEFQRIVGWSSREAAGASLMEEVYPDPQYRAEISRHMAAYRGGWLDIRMRTRNGRDIETSWANIRLSDDTHVGIGIDITERRQIEAVLRANEERFRLTFENAAVGIAHVALDGTFLRMNDKLCEITGYAREELQRLTFQDITHPDDLESDLEYARQLLVGERQTYSMEKRYIRKDGSVVWVNLTGSILHKANGEPDYFIAVVEDITLRKRAEATAQRQARLIELSHEPIFVWDLERGIVEWNAGAERLYGFSREEAIGRVSHALFHTVHPVPFTEFQRLLTSSKTWAGELRQTAKDGREVIVASRQQLIEVDGRQLVLETNRDVTEQKRAEEALREADRRKDEFLATLAHELRNPLAPMRNAVQILKLQGSLDRTSEAARDIIDRQVQHMVRLLDDLLDMSRITQDKLELRREHVELAEILEQALETSRPHLESDGHEISVSLPAEPVYLDADPVRLVQVFANLLNNASKYTQPGGQIWLTAEQHDAEVRVAVKDSGAGIPPDKLSSVFDLFTQLERPAEQSRRGLGIGLTLVKRLVEMHGGSVTARSDGPGQGSEFIVRLPILADPPVDGRAAAARPESNGARRLRVLVVDDNFDIADSLTELLEIEGHETCTVYDGLEAVEAAEWFRPDVALLDIDLPKLDGYEACRRIRQQPRGRDVMLVALTGWGQENARRKSQEVGFDYHLVKPVDLANLMALLAALPERGRHQT